MFDDKILLVTGGTGSFGNAMVDRLINSNLKEIRIFSRDEKKQHDMRMKYNNPKLKFIIGDVRDYNSIYNALKGVDYVFHAAALKQVPTCEFFPMEAIKTNVLGTENVLNACIENKVKKVIVLSTDKSVYPINTMGMTKALMEKIAISKSKESDTIICRTRYGNIIGSRGSVVPIFLKQIEEGKTLTITNPKMTRFMMSLKEAIELVLYAFEHGESGDLFVQKSPSVTIENLAKALISLKKSKSEIKYLGKRHGEKSTEVLITKEEMPFAIDEGKYYKVKTDDRTLLYKETKEIDTKEYEEYNTQNTKLLNLKETKELLKDLI